MNRLQAASLCGLSVLCASTTGAQDEVPAATPPTDVVAFKSGQSFVQWTTRLEPGVESTSLRLPVTVHGTLWVESDDVAVRSAHAHRAVATETRPVVDLASLLQRARGQVVTIETSTGSGEPITGTLRAVLIARGAEQPYALPYGAYLSAPSEPVYRPALAVIETGASITTVPVDAIVRVETPRTAEGGAEWTYEQPIDAAVLDVSHSAAADAGATLATSAMITGLAWAPSYALDLLSPTRAALVAKAVIVNDAQPLRDTRMHLAVGYPNLEFADVDSALLPARTWRQFRDAILGADRSASGGGPRSGLLSNVMSQSAVWGDDAGSSGAGLLEVPGESQEDLFLFDAGVVTLDAGERMYLPLFEREVAYAHRYDWDLPATIDRNARYRRNDDAQEDPPIWHVLRLENGADAPWTTGPVLLRAAGRPIAQSMMTYTPRGEDATVRVTKALDLVGRSTERRTDTPSAQVRRWNNTYEEIEIAGELRVANHKAEAVRLRVRRDLAGELLAVGGDGRVENRDAELQPVNVQRRLTWEPEIAPGETWSVEYTYRALVSR